MMADKKQQAKSLGFEWVQNPPPHLVNRAEELFQKRERQNIYIENIFSRQELDRELFIFDVGDSQGEDTQLGVEVFGIITRELALPRFSLTTLPGFSGDSLLGGLMERLMDKILNYAEKYLGMSRIEFPGQPEIDEQLVVFGRDEYAVRDLMRGIHLSTLMESKIPIHIEGNGDFLTVDFTYDSTSHPQNKDLQARYRQFIEIIRSFMN
jgi:hypothetical protein